MSNLEEYNAALAEKIDEHNKEVIESFIQTHETRGSSESHIEKMVSDFKKLEPFIDFKLDQPTKKDINKLVAAVNTNKVRKDNGERYSEWSKDTINKTLSNFIMSFLGEKELWENTERVKSNPEVSLEADKIPKPRHIKKAVEEADNLRNKAMLLFGWATGARIGELMATDKDPEPIRWEDIKFKEDFMTVKVSESGTDTRGKKPEERWIPVKFSQYLMKEYYDGNGFDQEDPVFPKMRTKLDEGFDPMTDDAARRVIEDLFDQAGIPDKISRSPHDVFRKSCAIYWAYVGWSEYKLRQYFGWSKNSDAPAHYIEVTQEGLEKAMMEAFGEEYESGFEEDLLKPVQCDNCENAQSPVFSYCQNCGQELDPELKIHNKGEGGKVDLQLSAQIGVKASRNPDMSLNEIKREVLDDS